MALFRTMVMVFLLSGIQLAANKQAFAQMPICQYKNTTFLVNSEKTIIQGFIANIFNNEGHAYKQMALLRIHTITGAANQHVLNKILLKQLNWWSVLIILIFIVASIPAIIQIRTTSLQKQKKILIQKVDERTRDLNAKNMLLKKRTNKLEQYNSMLQKNNETIQAQSEELKSQAEELTVIAENLEQTNKELSQTNDTKNNLFSIIAHDLKNPFNVILGYSDLLINNFDTWDDAQKLEMLSYLKESSSNAYNLLDNLLNWSRSQNGIIEFSPSSINPSEISQIVLQEVHSSAKKKGIELINKFESENKLIYADKDMLCLICRNLLMNAIKFCGAGDKVFFDINDFDSENICFKIKDQGNGMTQEKVETIFNQNKNKSTLGTEGEKGTGLGLLLCHDFVVHHGGKIWVESKLGEGTTISFTIPKSG